MSRVSVKDLWVVYGRVNAVSGVSFDVGEGEIFGLIGPNGAGKTSTLKVLATILRPAAGNVWIDGVDAKENAHAVRTLIGYMPDEFGAYEDLTVHEYLQFFASAHGVERSRRGAVIGGVAELTDLDGKLETRVDALSRGMKQRVAVARLLLHDPEVLLLDEPTSGLDPRARVEFRELLKELRSMGKTIVVSSHLLEDLAQVCDAVGIVEAGRMVAQGPLAELLGDGAGAVEMKLSGMSDGLVDAIRGLDGVTSVDMRGELLFITLDESVLGVEALAERLFMLGAQLRSFRPLEPDLETAFLRITEGRTK